MFQFGKIIVFFLCLNVLATAGWSQVCTNLGQNPYSAFPVCGATKFVQKTVPLCSNNAVPAIGCSRPTFSTANPYWYKFTCYTAGTLGFIITPLSNVNEDYDWQLFDITGHDPIDLFTDPSLIVTANWAGTYGPTGASAAGTKVFECESDPKDNISTFAKMPVLVVGHEYLLLISHFLLNTVSEAGYTLSFEGGTASIVNPIIPVIQSAYAVCDGTEIVVKLNKKVNCNSLAADGSDFTVSGPAPIAIVSALGNGCSTGFDMDSIVLKLSGILSPGTYKVTSKTGSDGNTLIDNCNNHLATGLQSGLSFTPSKPTPMDSIRPVVCITDTLYLVFNKPMNCSSIAADGSDFSITGPTAVTIKNASGICTNGVSTSIRILLTEPIRVNGTFSLQLTIGSDGNSLIDECNQVTPAGSTLSFTTKNITTAQFQFAVKTGCKKDSLYLTHNGYGGTTNWQWRLDSNRLSGVQNPVLISKAFGAHTVQLSVNNRFCSDTASAAFIFPDNTVTAAFASADTLCPSDTLHFTDRSSSNAISWKWNFGNGYTANQQAPGPQVYPLTNRSNNYVTRLVVQNNLNCTDTAYKLIFVLASCYIAVPTAFTPNGDGLNDYLYPLNAFKADNLLFRIYNRYGQIIFETKDYTRKWDGRVNNQLQPSGTYVWVLNYKDRKSGQAVFLKGTTVLIR